MVFLFSVGLNSLRFTICVGSSVSVALGRCVLGFPLLVGVACEGSVVTVVLSQAMLKISVSMTKMAKEYLLIWTPNKLFSIELL